MSRLIQIETFMKVVDKGSLAAAAREQNLSSAAISKQITKLETELGVQLLVRSTRKISLTDMGAVYYEQCKRILEEVDAADALVNNMKAEPYGKLKMFCPRHFAAKYITPHLPEFLSLYPHIEIHMEIGERMPNFEEEGVDLMMGASMSASEGSIQRCLARTQYTICASPDYLKKNGTPKTPVELLKHSCLTHSMRRPFNRFYFQNNKELEFHPFICVNDAETLSKLAILGMGIVQLHHYAVRDALEEGKLVAILENETRKEIPIYLAMPPRRYPPGKVRCLIDFITGKIKKENL
jgi:DNA-binding transcriptional LysR family regulator